MIHTSSCKSDSSLATIRSRGVTLIAANQVIPKSLNRGYQFGKACLKYVFTKINGNMFRRKSLVKLQGLYNEFSLSS